MDDIRKIKNRIKSVNDTKKIVNAMYLIASTMFTNFKNKLAYSAEYLDASRRAVGAVSAQTGVQNEYTRQKSGSNAVIVIGSRKGLNGDYSKEIANTAAKLKSNDKSTELFVMGNNTQKLLREKKISFTGINNSGAKPNEDELNRVCSLCEKLFKNEGTGKVSLLYTQFSSNKEAVVFTRLLPLESIESETERSFVLLPDNSVITERVVKIYLAAVINNAILNSFCAEQSSCMLAMDSAGSNAADLLEELEKQYNHLRQNAITNEIAEITAGIKGDDKP
ncbi:MAG: F0F1 ATP synthase subunit gamma [Clostridiales bacterium]|nr:F0F1 ATP synthase subunit gamma [Clostridiales bacterium]